MINLKLTEKQAASLTEFLTAERARHQQIFDTICSVAPPRDQINEEHEAAIKESFRVALEDMDTWLKLLDAAKNVKKK